MASNLWEVHAQPHALVIAQIVTNKEPKEDMHGTLDANGGVFRKSLIRASDYAIGIDA